MRVASAYLLVVLIWSTTPLAIQWSSSGFTFLTALTLRMVLALAVCLVILMAMKIRLIESRKDWLLYAVGALGLFPNMVLVYWAAQYIPSGLMSILFGVYPFLVGIFSWLIFKEKVFTPVKVGAVLFAFAGLALVHLGQLQMGPQAALGVAAMMLACVLWAISSVWVKRLGQDTGPLRQGTGSLLLATPFFVLVWYWLDGEWPSATSPRAVLGVGYLVMAGSVLGHTLFFYILRRCHVITVSLVALLAPMLAITWGALLAGEALSRQTALGAIMILAGLFVFQELYRVRPRRPRWFKAARPAVRESV